MRPAASGRDADVIACEDTRHSARLLDHYGIRDIPRVSFHAHNEHGKAGIDAFTRNELVVRGEISGREPQRPAPAVAVNDVPEERVLGGEPLGERARRHMHTERGQLPRDLVHIGDHQQQALAGSEGGCQSTGLQRSVDSPRRAAFGLHLDHVRDVIPEVFPPLAGPLIGELAHGRAWGD